MALAIYQAVQEPHGSCTRLLLTTVHLKTALYPRENCIGPVPGPYGFGLPARVRIAHILPSRALHGHVGWVHLAMQSEALVILLQETYCTDAKKLELPNYQLAGSSLSRKHGLATFFHERLRYTRLDQSPPTSEIEWLCVDVDGYKIVNVYEPSPTRLRTLDFPVFPRRCLYAGNFNCHHADWGYDDNSPDGECLAGWASINCLALLYNAKDAASFYSGRWNTGTNPDLAFVNVGPNSRLPDRRVLEKSPGHNIDLRLLHHQGLLWQCQACLLHDGTSARPNGVTTLL